MPSKQYNSHAYKNYLAAVLRRNCDGWQIECYFNERLDMLRFDCAQSE
ncbi:MAG: hypothetical protein IJT35_00920 [Paludibacteraceae bacterium]|nr:hypothetical protein [Paludibacteraceae bacterium]